MLISNEAAFCGVRVAAEFSPILKSGEMVEVIELTSDVIVLTAEERDALVSADESSWVGVGRWPAHLAEACAALEGTGT